MLYAENAEIKIENFLWKISSFPCNLTAFAMSSSRPCSSQKKYYNKTLLWKMRYRLDKCLAWLDSELGEFAASWCKWPTLPWCSRPFRRRSDEKRWLLLWPRGWSTWSAEFGYAQLLLRLRPGIDGKSFSLDNHHVLNIFKNIQKSA